MKQKDILLIVAIVVVSAVIGIVFSHLLFHSNKRDQTVEVIAPISSEFQTPSTQYFNSSAFDPTRLIQISQNNNSAPFSNATNQ